MCGIAGIFAREPIEPNRVERMLAAIAYRGPDHREVKAYRGQAGGHLTVGQARLAIIDLSPEANQPFDAADKRSCLTFNGEFYNFQDLRKACNPAPSWRTNSDTEVALHVLDRDGIAGLDQLWGMFAGCYYRPQEDRLWLFRDRLGKKPLYIYPHAGRLYFASEPKAILAVLDHVPDLDEDALRTFFYLGYVPTDMCIFKGMFKLPAGGLLTQQAGGEYQISHWYDADQEPVRPEGDLQDIFFDAVAHRMIADVPLAAFLSGGLDSSLVVAAMAHIASKPVHTFSVRFDGPQVLDESPFARAVSEHCGTKHHEIVLGINTLRQAIEPVLSHFDEPFGDASAVPTYLVSQAARQQFTVALTGDGADEVFAGYRKYLGEHYLAKLGPYPVRKFLLAPLARMLPTGRTNRVLETNRRIRRLLAGDAPHAGARHVNWLHMSPVDGAHMLNLGDFNTVRQQLTQRLPQNASLNDCLKFDQALVLQDDMFVKIDRMSMKTSLELRSPFVDHRLVALANGLPASRKLAGTQRKRVLVERLGHLLPESVLNRPKTGFEMPLGAWLRGPLANWTEDRLFSDKGTETWVDHQALRNLWRAHRSGKLDCTETLWYHLVFATWWQGIYA